MPEVIIIVFEYGGHSKLDHAILDLNIVLDWSSSLNYKVHIISDVGQHTVNPGETWFCGNFRTILSTIKDDKIIIYYSGHGKNNSMLLPNNQPVKFTKFRDIITTSLHKNTEILIILDCCNPTGFSLPYKLINNRFTLREGNLHFVEHKILLITSSESSEKSIAIENSGSIFTKKFFEVVAALSRIDQQLNLQDKSRNLQKLVYTLTEYTKTQNTGYVQHISIYSSYIIDPILWMWIGKDNSYKNFLQESLLRLFK